MPGLRTGCLLALALGFSAPQALAESWLAGSAVPHGAPVIFEAVPAIGVPARPDAPIRRGGFSAGRGVFEVRGDFDPDRPGEEWSALPAYRIVIDAYGNRRRVKADPKDFTAVRWRRTGEDGRLTGR